MDFTALYQRICFLVVHVTVFEFPLVLWGTAAAAFVLARVLAKHNARRREARFARTTGILYLALSVITFIARFWFS